MYNNNNNNNNLMLCDPSEYKITSQNIKPSVSDFIRPKIEYASFLLCGTVSDNIKNTTHLSCNMCLDLSCGVVYIWNDRKWIEL
jgi:phosphoribosylanthranilate isomerase